MKVKKRILSLILTVALFSTLLPVAASAAVSTTYVDVNGVTQTVNATQITAATTTLSSGWYVADSSFTRDKVTTVSGSVNLILADGVYIGASDAVLDTSITVSGGNSLTIYGQAQGTGRLYIRGGPDGACIGGREYGTVGTITINGGTFELGGWYGSGLGGAAGSSGGTIIINGGTITARGGIDCAGIGSGLNAGGGSITINGGSVTASGGVSGSGIGGGRGGSGWNVTINGGTVNATGNTGGGSGGGAGIGGSYYCDGGSITINDGTVNATAGFSSAGIGGGAGNSGGVITINGGTVNAYGCDGAGIGGGAGGSGGSITITGGVIDARGSSGGAGIGGGPAGSSGTIKITGGIITAIGGSGTYQVLGEDHFYQVAGGSGIGNGVSSTTGTITIEGGTITATGGDGAYYSADDVFSFLGGGAGIGGGQYTAGGTIFITSGTITATGKAGGSGIGGGEDGAGGTINISGGNIKATGSESSPGIGGGQMKNRGTASSGGTVSVSGGIVFSAAGPGITLYTEPTMDIGPGGGGTPGSLSITGTAAVFLKNDRCTAPTVSVNHTHESSVRPSLSTGDAYGFTLPNWVKAPNIGAYLYLIPVTYHANQEGLPPEEETVTVFQHIGTTGVLLGVAGARLNGFSLVGWNTAAAGGTSYMPQASYTFNAPLTLYAQWEVSKYAVTWKTQDGLSTLEADIEVTHGSQPSYDVENDPTKGSTPQYDYTFAGWATSPGQTSGTPEAELGAAIDDTTYFAAFSETLRSYTVAWKSQDGSQTLETDIDVPYGTTLSFGVGNPTKTDTAQYHYSFAGWATSPDQTSGTAVGSLPTLSGPVTYYAAFNETVRNYTVTFNSNGGSAVSSQNVSYNNTAAAPAAPSKAGHTLAGWYTDSELTAVYNFSTTVMDNITLYAKWTVNTYALSFNTQGGDAVSAIAVTYNAAVGVLPTASRSGYTFTGWYTGTNGAGTNYTAATIYQTAGNLTLHAKWTPNTYALSFDSQGGGDVSFITATYNAPIGAIPSALKSGYTLVGWYTSENGAGTKYTAETVYQTVGNLTLYAYWTEAPFTLSFDSQGGDAVLPIIVMYKAAVGVLPTASRSGCTFAGWFTDTNGAGTEYTAGTVYETADNLTLYAKWTPNSYTLSFDSQGGSSASPITATYNAPIGALPGVLKPGYTLEGWYTGTNGTGTKYTAETVYQYVGNLTLYAKWTPNTYMLSLDSQGGSNVSPRAVTYNAPIGTLPGASRIGYTFEGWYTGTNGAGTRYTVLTVYQTADNLTLYAKWRPNIYTLPVEPEGGSSVPSMTVTYDALMGTLPIATKPGYILEGWYAGRNGDGIKFTAETYYRYAFELALFANWTPDTYTLSFDVQGGDDVSPILATYNEEIGDLPGASKACYTFAGWFTGTNGAGIEYNAETEYQTAGDLTLYAKWTPKTYKLTFDSQGEGDISDISVTYGAAVGILPVAAKTGYTLEGWYTGENGTGAKYTAETAYHTADNMTLFANWKANTYTISFDSQGGSTVPPITVFYDAAVGTLPTPTKTGVLIVGWNTQPDGLGTHYTDETVYQTAGGLTLYAVWAKLYSITYILNEGTGTAPNGAFQIAGASFSAAGSAGMIAPYGKRFKEWNTAADGIGIGYHAGATVTTPDVDLIFYAIWEIVYANPDYNATVSTATGEGKPLAVKVNADTGVASVDAGGQRPTTGGTVITIPSIQDADIYSVSLSISELSTPDKQGTLMIKTENGCITIPSNMLIGIKLPDGSSEISGNKAEIIIGQGDKGKLPAGVKTEIGDRPLISLTLSIDGRQTDWSNPDAPVTVSIPYTPTAAELNNPGSIVIWYINGSGHVVTVPNGYFDPATGMVTFHTTHFSNYAVAYNPVRFSDILSGVWYNAAVEFIAAREITSGTGGSKYSPAAKLTRGEFIVMIMRAYSIAPDLGSTDNFNDAGDTYYTGYLASVKHLGISAGIGSNLFAPDKEITRQEMFTLLYNTLRVLGQLPQGQKLPEGDVGKALTDFTDADQIDAWAKEAMTRLVETGIVSGNTGKVMPRSITTRAEFAQILYKLLTLSD